MKKYEAPKLEELKFNIVSGFCITESKSNIIPEEIGEEDVSEKIPGEL